MKVLVTGAGGRLGTALLQAPPDVDVVAARRNTTPAIDLDNPATATRAVEAARPDAVLHTAAWTDVDACEAHPHHAMQRNAAWTAALARACHDHGARLVLVSTDYVFGGDAAPYRPQDPSSPVNAYGRSKAAAEEAVRDTLQDARIVRTSMLHGAPHRTDIISWLTARVRDQQPFAVVAGHRACPTHVADLAAALWRDASGRPGTHHLVGADAMTRPEMAEAIATRLGLPCLARPTDALPWKARRPDNATLVGADGRPGPLPGLPSRLAQEATA